MDEWIDFSIQSLPGWRYKDLISLPMPVVNRAIEAANKRRDEDNKFQAAIHGIKWQEEGKKVKNEKSQVEAIKQSVIASASKGAKTISRAELLAARKNKT